MLTLFPSSARPAWAPGYTAGEMCRVDSSPSAREMVARMASMVVAVPGVRANVARRQGQITLSQDTFCTAALF